jgi:YD repeat-containing protein
VKNGDAQLVTYVYDKAGEMTSVKDWSGNTTTFTWTADGELATQVGADGLAETRSYDPADNLTQIADATSSATLATYGYGYDAATQLTSAGDGTTATPYVATAGGELIASGSAPTETYNSAAQLASSTTATGASISYGYDAYGNLATAILANGVSVAYTSNADGLRQSETVGSATNHFVWDTQAAVPLLLDDGSESYIYGPWAIPIAQTSDSSAVAQYLHADVVGSVRLITDSAGTAIGTTEYDPYGNVTSHTGSAISASGLVIFGAFVLVFGIAVAIRVTGPGSVAIVAAVVAVDVFFAIVQRNPKLRATTELIGTVTVGPSGVRWNPSAQTARSFGESPAVWDTAWIASARRLRGLGDLVQLTLTNRWRTSNSLTLP